MIYYTYDIHVEGAGKNEMLSDVGERGEGGGLAMVLGIQFFLLKKNGFKPWPDIMLTIYYWQEIFLLTLMSDSEAIL